jgi:hypothetical protein
VSLGEFSSWVSQVIDPSGPVTQFLGFTLVEGPTELPGPTRKLSAWAQDGVTPRPQARQIEPQAAKDDQKAQVRCIAENEDITPL